MAGQPFKDGPAFVANSVADLYNNSSAAVYTLIRHIHLVNKDASARTLVLYIGATGGSASGTEILDDYSIAAGDFVDLYFPSGLKLVSTDFLSGVASAASAIVCTIAGELYAA